MNIATQSVEALSPEAFAALESGPFPCAPRYGREDSTFSDPSRAQTDRRAMRLCQKKQSLPLLQREFLDGGTLVLFPVLVPSHACKEGNPPKHN